MCSKIKALHNIITEIYILFHSFTTEIFWGIMVDYGVQNSF
jgi:hypothetical protein